MGRVLAFSFNMIELLLVRSDAPLLKRDLRVHPHCTNARFTPKKKNRNPRMAVFAFTFST
jgi:hypothetical protein